MANGDHVVLGTVNYATKRTGISLSGATNEIALQVDASGNVGVLGNTGTGTGVQGNGKIGVFGRTGAANGTGVYGDVFGATPGQGVWGQASDGTGVYGNSARQVGVRGIGGVTGVDGSSITGVGVRARSSSGDSVNGYSSNGSGVVGQSQNRHGIVGVSTANSGVYGHSYNGAGVVGSTGNPNDYAGFFWGAVWVNGAFTVAGPKSAAVPHRDGSHRLVYSLECPESWLEDFGRARITRGRGRVRFAKDFGAVVRTADYHVFLTPEGDSRGLFVSRRDSKGFEGLCTFNPACTFIPESALLIGAGRFATARDSRPRRPDEGVRRVLPASSA